MYQRQQDQKEGFRWPLNKMFKSEKMSKFKFSNLKLYFLSMLLQITNILDKSLLGKVCIINHLAFLQVD